MRALPGDRERPPREEEGVAATKAADGGTTAAEVEISGLPGPLKIAVPPALEVVLTGLPVPLIDPNCALASLPPPAAALLPCTTITAGAAAMSSSPVVDALGCLLRTAPAPPLKLKLASATRLLLLLKLAFAPASPPLRE